MVTLPLSPAYRSAVRFTLALQIPLALFLSILLDGGALAKPAACAMAGFWIGVAAIMIRRPQVPTPGDLLYIRVGVLPMYCVAMVMAGARQSLI